MKLVVCITGASGSLYAKRIFLHLSRYLDGAYGPVEQELEVSWVTSGQAPMVWQHELGTAIEQDADARFQRWDRKDFRTHFVP